jgi:hypothetical protein
MEHVVEEYLRNVENISQKTNTDKIDSNITKNISENIFSNNKV